MTDLRQAAQAVLERWDSPLWQSGTTAAAIADLRTALEQSKQEPSQWRDMVVVNLVREGINKHRARDLADHFVTPPPAAQPEQEPVAWICYGAPGKRDIDFEESDINELPIGTHLYTTPPAAQRPWVGLTEGERNDLEDYCQMTIGKTAFDAIEARLKERNT